MRYFCCAILVACSFAFCAHCNNISDGTLDDTSPQSVERISQFYFMLVGLMKQYELTNMPHYSKFFDAALMSEARVMFLRLRKFAANMTQGMEWEKVAEHSLKLYVIHIIASQARALFEYRAQFDRLPSSYEPSMLQMASLAQVEKQIKRYLNEEFRYSLLNDPVFLYELMYFIKLPVSINELNASPYFVIHLKEDHLRRRFFNNYCEPDKKKICAFDSYYSKLYAPAENFANEIEIFHRAQTNVLKFINEPACDIELNMLVSTHVTANLNRTLEIVLMDISTKHIDESTMLTLVSLRSAVLFSIFCNYLQREYNRLVCHPAFGNYWANYSKKEIVHVQNQLEIFYECLWQLVTKPHMHRGSSPYCRSLITFYEAIQRLNVIVGYTPRADAAIAMFDVMELSSAFNATM